VTKPRVLGITGGIATGKSTVMAILRELGAETIDADRVYHQLIAPGGALVPVLTNAFGPQVAATDGAIDRSKLGQIVFSDPESLQQLDALTHPAVASAIRAQIIENTADVIAIDAVKLVESGLANDCDAVWLVVANRDLQRQRLMERNHMSVEQAEMRLNAQPTFEAARQIATEVIDNSGTIDGLHAAVRSAWQRFAA
jgi:dephospho-CoA kinase